MSEQGQYLDFQVSFARPAVLILATGPVPNFYAQIRYFEQSIFDPKHCMRLHHIAKRRNHSTRDRNPDQ